MYFALGMRETAKFCDKRCVYREGENLGPLRLLTTIEVKGVSFRASTKWFERTKSQTGRPGLTLLPPIKRPQW